MQLPEAKQKFIEAWGKLGSEWGINRTMAQVHALLLISPEALTTEDVMESLQISRGNANMNLGALIDWGLIEKRMKRGERIEFFEAEKDKGCDGCWVSSAMLGRHPECVKKIEKWFMAREELAKKFSA